MEGDEEANFRLSETQSAVFSGWKRPDEVLPLLSKQPQLDIQPSPDTAMVATQKIDLVQDMLSSIFYPYDYTLQRPVRSKNGKYIFRLYFNGCWRKVVIDDRLPASNGSRTLHVFDRRSPHLLWPALVEKAYLKIRGGYDFLGSNSGSDLWVLTGWIPEQIFLQRYAFLNGKVLGVRLAADWDWHSDTVDRESVWRKIVKAFSYGDVLITLGTGKTNQFEECATGLPGEHDFAVINLEESGGRQAFLIKNPWSEAFERTASATTITKQNDLEPKTHLSESTPKKHLDAEQNPMEPGTFWMNIHNVFQYFESLYLNWNPCLFSYREDIHFSWNVAKTNGLWASFCNNPQYRVHSQAGGTVWLVLSHHFGSTHQAGSAMETGFISLYLFKDRGDKIYLTNGFITRGPYVDSPNTLLKTELPPGTPHTVVISEQKLQRSSHSFTLSAFSLQPLTISETSDRYRCHTIRTAAWTPATSGGNANSPNYSNNPQFSVKLPRQSDVSILLELHSGEYPVHVKLLWSDGSALGLVRARNIVVDSGEYRKGHALAETYNVPAGEYVIVCSTFEQGQLGEFTLQVGTMSECTVQRVFAKPLGQFVSRPGTAVFSGGTDRLWAPVWCQRLTRLSVVAQSSDGAGSQSSQPRPSNLPLKLSFEIGHGLTKQIVASSGNDEFSNGFYGVQLSDIDVQPYMCAQAGARVTIERAGPLESTVREGVEVEIYSDTNIEVGHWVE
ncbi:MAG: hypothetical protein Q9219_002722 [cf. Caloplaca sp. 3 TL-2023]